jgi:hypothetical protein
MTGAASLAFMMASAAVVRAQTVIGADGPPGADCSTEFCHGGNGDGGEPVSSDGNSAAAFGGSGGSGGNALVNEGFGGFGGSGGAASASGANATAVGGAGGAAGDFVFTGTAGAAGNGGDADAGSGATSNGSSNATSAATATGGAGGEGIFEGFEIVGAGAGGNATATSSATAKGSGNAISSATAAGGGVNGGLSEAGNATAASSATAKGSGTARASATATGGVSGGVATTANATSYAETAEGGLAQAQTQTQADFGEAQSTAKTTFGGVRVQSTVESFGGSTNAIAQGGSGQSPANPEQSAFAFSTALPNIAYATTLIGSASHVADALLGPDDKIFGTAILGGFDSSSSTFDFSFRGDLILGVMTDGGFDIVANGTDIPFEDLGDNSVINLGSIFGPNIDLTIEGDGVFAVGGVAAAPETSTWAMMLLGFAGLGYAGYRRAREPRAA